MNGRTLLARMLVLLLAVPAPVRANPSGGAVQSGDATITGVGSAVVDVHQRSPSAVLSWERFDIQPGETTNFLQPGKDAVAINRILDGQASRILGSLNATGHVYLINPNGIVFGKGAAVNVHKLTAAASVDAHELAKGGFDPSAQAAPGARITHEGTITTGAGGAVYLVAPQVENGTSGVIVSPEGEVRIEAGRTVYLTDRADGRGLLVEYRAPAAPDGEAVNLGRLVADGGLLRVRAEIIRQGGEMQANAVRESGGRIELYADASLSLGGASRTLASGGAGAASGGEVIAKSEGDAAVEAGAQVDVSGGAIAGAAGRIEVSAERTLDLSGEFRAAGHGGSRGGRVVIDPEVLRVSGAQSYSGAESVLLSADRNVSFEAGASVALRDPTGTPSFAVRSGQDISFAADARIHDADGQGADATRHWNVQLVAGATQLEDIGSLEVAPTPGADGAPEVRGGVYLSGAQLDAEGRVLRDAEGRAAPGTGSGRVELTHGDVTVRAEGDLWVGDGGGLHNREGDIDVAVGRDVRFHVTQNGGDGVIENEAGAIRVAAGGSVVLRRDADDPGGNAAIRTRGRILRDDSGNERRERGGDVLVEAGEDVDAGRGNRWLRPLLNEPDPEVDVLPVAREGILGIGSEAGGHVTVVAGRNVVTDGGIPAQRSGGSASQIEGRYDRSHIGVFGEPVEYRLSPVDLDQNGEADDFVPVPLGDARTSRLTVIAGGDLSGDFMAREGEAFLRAGYRLADGARAGPALGDAQLVASDAALADPTRGWLGPLARPLTVDLVRASLDGKGYNGVAIRAIENPSLVYPPSDSLFGNQRAPSYAEQDVARLEAETGDVVLVGNDLNLERAGSSAPDFNLLALLLPPSLVVKTHRFTRGRETRGGDLVVNGPFQLFPSRSGGLTLDVAGKVRGARRGASDFASLDLEIFSTGSASERELSLPGQLVLYDAQRDLELVLRGPVFLERRADPTFAQGTVNVVLTPEAAASGLDVPAGQRLLALDGRVYRTAGERIPSLGERSSVGSAVFTAERGNTTLVSIPQGTRLMGANGVRFVTTESVALEAGASRVAIPIEAEAGFAGVDAAAFELQLASPLAGVASATNLAPTRRSLEVQLSVVAEEIGAQGNAQPREIVRLLDAIPGIQTVANRRSVGRGADVGVRGDLNAGRSNTLAVAQLKGPVGAVPVGSELELRDPSQLPAGVAADELHFVVSRVLSSGGLLPVVFKSLQIERGADGVIESTSVDPKPNEIVLVDDARVWQSAGRAGIRQSDADGSFDARTPFGSFDYATYLGSCRTPCTISDPITGRPRTLGAAPTHALDRTPASLFAAAGFERIAIDLAEAADLWTQGSIQDLALQTQHNDPGDVTTVRAPNGDVSFGAVTRTLLDNQDPERPRTTQVDDEVFSGVQVGGPGVLRVLVGVEPNSTAGITLAEWLARGGSVEVFEALDERGGPVDTGRLSPEETPWVPVAGEGGKLSLQNVAGVPLGIESLGNLRNPNLPAGGVEVEVVADGAIDVGKTGAISSLQGGDIRVISVSGNVTGGRPPAGTFSKRGVVTLAFDPLGGGLQSAGGGSITIDAHGDVDSGGTAFATISAGDISLESRGGSVIAGEGQPISGVEVRIDPSTSLPSVTYRGAGISASPPGSVDIVARENVDIGAGITGGLINIDAGGNVIASGSGAISGTDISISVGEGGSISGNISASGSVSLSGSASGASVSAGGLVSGGGASVGTGGAGKTSTETATAAESAAGGYGGLGGLGDAGGGRRSVIIDVSSQPCEDLDRCS